MAHALEKNGWQLKGRFLDLPQDKRFGDLASNVAMRVAGLEKKSPREIASKIIQDLKEDPFFQEKVEECIQDIKVEGAGFINFYFSNSYFYSQLHQVVVRTGDAMRVDLGKGSPVLIEFVSANPTGPLSVAHARQAAVGDALAGILAYCGFSVQREYYLNDEGNQINILGRSVQLRLKELQGEGVEFPEDHYQGDYIRDMAKEILDNKIKVDDFREFAKDKILDVIKKELEDFGVRFDSWFSQKALEESGKIRKVLDELKQKSFMYEQDGASWFRSTDFGDDKDRVVIKSDGSYTYLAPDIAYHADKYSRGFKKLVNLWGPDHHGYINRLKAAVLALGQPGDSLAIIIVQLATIFREGNPVQMSTRKGQYITLREVLDEVGLDASRFFFLMRKTSSHLDFDLEVAKKQTAENPVYYVQYAHARICSILRTAGAMNLQDADLALLNHEEELGLIKKICQFTVTLSICANTLDPYMMTVYLQELAEVFHKFYDVHRVLGTNEGLTRARLALIEATSLTISEGLKLLGVSRPEKM